MRVEFSKVVGALCLVLFFGLVSVFAGNVFVGEEGLRGVYSSSSGSEGISFNMSFSELVDGGYELVVEDGLVVGVFNGSNSSGGNESGPSFPSSGLISYYSFDVGADDDYGNNDGTVSGASLTSGDSGKLGEAYNFDGSNDYVTLPNYAITGAWTISLWVKSFNTEDLQYFIDFSSGRIVLQYYPTYGISITSAMQIWADPIIDVDGTWQHVVATSDGADVSLYIDGNYIGTDDSAADLGGTVKLGLRYVSGTQPLDGQLDEVGIWDRDLTSTEIGDLYNDGDGLAYE